MKRKENKQNQNATDSVSRESGTVPQGGDTSSHTGSDRKDANPAARKKDGDGRGPKPPPAAQNKGPAGPSSKPASHGSQPLFPEGTKALESIGLSISGRNNRVLSQITTQHYFHLTELSWSVLTTKKPEIAHMFSLAEWQHCHALMLYGRVEKVKFEALGVKPPAPVRIPLPKSLQVFQPVWSSLASIGVVEDNELGVVYIPDVYLPETDAIESESDVENLLSCTCYDWSTSWNSVLEKRRLRSLVRTEQVGIDFTAEEFDEETRLELIREISELRGTLNRFDSRQTRYTIKDGVLQAATEDDEETTRDAIEALLSAKIQLAREYKAKAIRPVFNTHQSLSLYSLSEDVIVTDPGAYGRRLHWDSQLWVEYSQIVEMLIGISMFSIDMPIDTTGTYTWLLPVSKQAGDHFCKMPKRSISSPTWILAIITQFSTLPEYRRSTWYIQTDRVSDIRMLTLKWINAAFKRPAPVEQYGVG